MKKQSVTFVRRLAPILAAGMLLQAGSCAIDPTATGLSFLSAITGGLIRNVVFGAFNLPI